MKIAFCTSEMGSLIKVGGLADVSESLPKALKNLSEDVFVFLPLYKKIKQEKKDILQDTGVEVTVEIKKEMKKAKVLKADVGNIPVYLIEYDPYFNRDYPYGTPEGDYPDNPYRFAFFCQAVLEATKKLNLDIEVFHCNDWETALIPVYMRHKLKEQFEAVSSVLTIHNLAYQGVFHREVLCEIGLDWSLFHMDALEYYGNVNYLKGGIVFADIINTVSPTYAKEIQTEKYGYGLDGILRKRKTMLFGVINGIDYNEWNPQKDERIFENYDSEHLEGKLKNKIFLKEAKGLLEREGPLAGMVGRLVEQKGVDLLHTVVGDMVKMGMQLIVLGSGEKRYHEMLKSLERMYPNHVSINIGYDDKLAARIYAGCDLFLMPSRYEPCGLGQMISLRYGTIPVVRSTGGLADTIEDFDPETKRGNGFVFHDFKPQDFLEALQKALSVYQQKEDWIYLVKKAMKYDFSWDASAKRYLELYRRALFLRR